MAYHHHHSVHNAGGTGGGGMYGDTGYAGGGMYAQPPQPQYGQPQPAQPQPHSQAQAQYSQGGMWGAGAPPAPAPTSTAYGQAHPHPHPHGAAMDPMAQFGQMANLVSNPMFSSMAANVADWDNRKQQVEQNVSRLKYYFNVNNSYVLNKLKLLAFPWLHKHWQRRQAGDGSGPGQYLPPREDVNAPDLYIPSMAFVTFILTAGLFYGYQEEFSPEKLGIVASSTLAWLVLEVGLIVLGLYLLNVATDYSFIDIVCYCGYKYLSMIAAMLAFIFTDSDMTAYYVVLAYMSCAVGFFLLRTLRFVINPDSNSVHQPTATAAKRNYFLVVVAAMQALMAYFLTAL